MRVLHCPDSIAGNPGGLAKAEREIGLDSRAVALLPSIFNFATDEVLCDASDDVWQRERKRWVLLWRALRWADVVHFNFGKTIAPGLGVSAVLPRLTGAFYGTYKRVFGMRDLPLLRAWGKALFVTFQGDDARQVDRSLDSNEITHVRRTPESDVLDVNRRETIRRFDRYVHGLFALNPDLLHTLPPRAEFLPYASIDPREWPSLGPGGGKVPVVAHAPTNREAKGTAHVIEACDRLRREGVALELDLVEGLSHNDARRRYERADIVVDQVLAGWYGAFAVEVMALAKPVVAYIREKDLTFVPEPMRNDIPVIRSTPDELHAVLRRHLTVERHRLVEIGLRSRVFVERWHHPVTVARHTAQRYLAASQRRRGWTTGLAPARGRLPND